MLEQLTLRNFQAHRKLKLRFDPTITTIVGTSDVGKTAIIRALQWITTNKPGGDAFIAHGTDLCSVSLVVDSRRITRLRGKTQNEYELDGNTFKSFGAEPPDAAKNLLNLGPVNFQNQHDAPFWFSDTAGAVSRSLNQIVNLGAIDDTLAYLASRARQASARTVAAKERQAAAGQQWEKVKDATTTDHALRGVEELAECVKVSERQTAAIASLLGEGSRHVQTAERAGETILAGKAAVLVGERWAELDRRREGLGELLSRAGELSSKAGRTYPTTENLESLYEQHQSLSKQCEVLTVLLDQADSWKTAQQREAARASQAQAEFSQKLGAQCPLCGSKI